MCRLSVHNSRLSRNRYSINLRNYVRLAARIRDLTVSSHFDCEGMIVAALQSCRFEALLCQFGLVVRPGGILRCDRHFLRSDFQLAIHNRYQVVAYRGLYRHFVSIFVRGLPVRHRFSINCIDDVRLFSDIRNLAVGCHHYIEGMSIA